MKLVLAEKPSVARDIARVLGATQSEKIGILTYYKNTEYIVSNFRGHLVGLAMPEIYDISLKKWQLDTLPINPKKWIFTPNYECEAHIKAVSKLMNAKEVDTIISATDAGREGELIFRYVYNFATCKKPVKRLWISSLTDESIKQGLKNLLDNAEKESLYQAGDARSKADWLIGMNLSRLYSILYNTKLSVGRVQTPTLNMVVTRDEEIKGFSKAKYYTLSLDNGAEFYDKDGDNTFTENTKAEKIASECNSQTIQVSSVETKEKSENRPLLYSLTSLQKDANEKLGYSANKTLVALQGLYEKKLTTYPRTDSDHITDDMKETVENVVKALDFYDPQRISKLQKTGLNLDKRVVDNSKVSDHHAVIPTKEIYKLNKTNLELEEKAIAELVIKRFLIALDMPYIYSETEYIFQVSDYQFKLLNKSPVKLGWREYELEKDKENGKDKLNLSKEKAIVIYKKGEVIKAKASVIEKETKPPKTFTESTLLSAMENISKRIEDKTKREFVKKSGLGTPATRANIFEELLKKGFIERKDKKIISTASGREFIKLLPENVKSVELTADMESRLSDIEKGKTTELEVLTEINKFIMERIMAEKDVKHTNLGGDRPKKVSLGKCPECGGEVYEGEKNFYCANRKTDGTGCTFGIWKNDKFWENKKKKLTSTTIKNILATKKVLIEDFKSEKTGKVYSAFVSIEKVQVNGKTYHNFKMEFPKG
jgi:DNA topoisomerase-3